MLYVVWNREPAGVHTLCLVSAHTLRPAARGAALQVAAHHLLSAHCASLVLTLTFYALSHFISFLRRSRLLYRDDK